jgi:hypothetical protein
MKQYGASYGYQGWLEQHYQREVGDRLGPQRHYLDYTGQQQQYPAPDSPPCCSPGAVQHHGDAGSTPMASSGVTGMCWWQQPLGPSSSQLKGTMAVCHAGDA